MILWKLKFYLKDEASEAVTLPFPSISEAKNFALPSLYVSRLTDFLRASLASAAVIEPFPSKLSVRLSEFFEPMVI